MLCSGSLQIIEQKIPGLIQIMTLDNTICTYF